MSANSTPRATTLRRVGLRVWLAVAAGGAIGALTRWLVAEASVAWLGTAGGFPWGTLAANVLGCALIGLLAPMLISRSAWVWGFVVTGFLGGFTTYSAFAEETFILLDRGDLAGLVLAFTYVLVTIGATSAAVALGHRLGAVRSTA